MVQILLLFSNPTLGAVAKHSPCQEIHRDTPFVAQVDQDTETYMSRFFMVSGILSFLALAFCFAGILQHTFYGSHVSARPFYASVYVDALL